MDSTALKSWLACWRGLAVIQFRSNVDVKWKGLVVENVQSSRWVWFFGTSGDKSRRHEMERY